MEHARDPRAIRIHEQDALDHQGAHMQTLIIKELGFNQNYYTTNKDRFV